MTLCLDNLVSLKKTQTEPVNEKRNGLKRFVKQVEAT